MVLHRVLGLICLVISMTLTTPVPDDVFLNFLRNAPSEESFLVKRRIFEDNTDRKLKQISLSSLVGDLENNIYASAFSLNKILTSKDTSAPEIKVNEDLEHDVNKRQSLIKEEINFEPIAKITTTLTESSTILPVTNKVIVQTTEKVSQANGVPTHIVIDRFDIQPHTGGLALIPIFELKHNGKDEEPNKDHKITISKNDVTSSTTAPSDYSNSSSTTNSSSSSSTSAPSTITTTQDVLKIVTTPKNVDKLKEAEEELKEKFAEIEAEPIILSARV